MLIWYCFAIIIGIFLLLFINKTSLYKIGKKFEFGFKLFYCVMYIIAAAMHDLSRGKLENKQEIVYRFLFENVLMFIAILIATLLDGFQYRSFVAQNIDLLCAEFRVHSRSDL